MQMKFIDNEVVHYNIWREYMRWWVRNQFYLSNKDIESADRSLIEIVVINIMSINIHEKRYHEGRVCFRDQHNWTDEKWINQTGGQAKVNWSKMKSYITIYEDNTCVDEWEIKYKSREKILNQQTGHDLK